MKDVSIQGYETVDAPRSMARATAVAACSGVIAARMTGQSRQNP